MRKFDYHKVAVRIFHTSSVAEVAVCEFRRSNLTVGDCVFIATATVIYSFGHGLHKFIAVPEHEVTRVIQKLKAAKHK